MAGLADLLRRRIALEGPLTVAQYMEACLAHPEHGYYRKRDPLGRAGDFTTVPEISQMFGELIGLWAAVVWQGMGGPRPLRLVELGPGRGTLMADALRAAAGAPGFTDAIEVHLVETSPALRERQAAALAGHAPIWHDDLMSLPEGPAVVIANEFFDALPIRQFQRSPDGWHERLVDVDDDGALRFRLSPPQLVNPLVPDSLKNAESGSVAEICPAALGVVRQLAERLHAGGGAALIIDYGHAASAAGETLQAVKDHAFHDVLAEPGDADLTAHVDFQALGETAKSTGARGYGPISQARFLQALGIRERAEALLAGATAGQAADIRAALERLTGPEAMGEMFKVLCVAAPELPPPPGFEA